jgi:hypothetical protein
LTAYGKPNQHIEAHVDLIDRLSLSEQEALSAALAVLGAEELEDSHDAEESGRNRHCERAPFSIDHTGNKVYSLQESSGL